ncbi:MAG: 50S ribosomal protein L28 [uncultured Aureispira sp.]|uniref:Large ribosomal subunit protein bL28 n=1 Tax=uncultured Aureispira sp. TaxID=1331704 RepID=A0A6S6U4K0_9BACT|nr:MAG: 50S ribosomal protein L28 [uncultured Aureispira sp.]
MSKICQLTGTKPLVGNNVSHSKRRTKRRFNPNLQTKRIYVREIDSWVKVKLTTRALRNMEKIGTFKYLKQQIAAGFDPKVWVEDAKSMEAAKTAKRGYRRVEHVDANGHKSYSITFEPEGVSNKKVKLSSVIK